MTTIPEPPAAGGRPPGPEPAAPPSTDRLLALSDGVVAIALTLLILQIAVPAATALKYPDSASALAGALGKNYSAWISYAVSFYVIAQFWLNHHRVFRQIDKQTDGLAAWNFAFLFTISVMPFTSDLLGKFNSNPLAIDIFAFNLFLANLATLLMLEFGDRHQLFSAGIKRDRFSSRIHILVGITVGLISIALAWYSTTLAQCSWLLFAVVPQAGDAILRLSGRHPDRNRQTSS